MTLEDWQKNEEYAAELLVELQKPIMVQAFALLQSMTMAKALNGQGLLTITNTKELFGYDVGRASIFRDLETLATSVTKQTQQLKTNYGKTSSTTTNN